jgi:nitrate/TMAO reductase-like tetraheme cytochrome c subunit
MTTSRECIVCHSTTAWTPLTFTHASSEYPGNHNSRLGLTCISCHTTNTDAATWRNATYRPACAGCHANDYESGPHTKVNNVSKYTVSELRNCAGACHIYTDATLTTIRTTRNGEHRVTDNEF